MTEQDDKDIKKGTKKYEEKEAGVHNVPPIPAKDPGLTSRTREESKEPKKNKDLPTKK